MCHGHCRSRCIQVCILVNNLPYQNKMLYYQRRASFVLGVVNLSHVIDVLIVRGFGILDRTFIVSWSLSITLHTSLHTSQELPVPEQGPVLPEASVVRFFGMSILRVLVLMGLMHWHM